MTRLTKAKTPKALKARRRPRDPRPSRWLLQDAKARSSELVRPVHAEGPQHVTVRERDEIVVIAAEDVRRLQGDLSGAALVAALQASPHRELGIEPRRARFPVRDAGL